MPELLYKLINMWKKNSSFFWVLVLFVFCEVSYITSVQGNENAAWYQCINYFYVLLWVLPAIIALGYIFVMRAYMPKAKKGTTGIAFFIVNANEKQYDAINKKFISRVKKAVSDEIPSYSIIVIDDYHSQKLYPLLSSPVTNQDGQKQAKILNDRRCTIAILIDCINGGDSEELFCHMTTNVGVAHQTLPSKIRECLIKDISAAFSPLREVDIMKLTETPDLSQHSLSMEIICKYTLASICFHCKNFEGALKLLNTININLANISAKKELPDAIVPIKNVINDRIAVCCFIRAQYEYYLYCTDYKDSHLITIREMISNVHCKQAFEKDNKILEGICSFVLDNNIDYAIECMGKFNQKDPVVKYNKFFLLLYRHCTTNNVGRTYNLYKSFGTLPANIQEQIEGFTYNEYKKDPTKKQLLLILMFIYDYQNNLILAKRCFEQFSSEFPWVNENDVAPIFKELNEKYAGVKYDEGEMYSI